jgi:hypothetical protein
LVGLQLNYGGMEMTLSKKEYVEPFKFFCLGVLSGDCIKPSFSLHICLESCKYIFFPNELGDVGNVSGIFFSLFLFFFHKCFCFPLNLYEAKAMFGWFAVKLHLI